MDRRPEDTQRKMSGHQIELKRGDSRDYHNRNSLVLTFSVSCRERELHSPLRPRHSLKEHLVCWS